MTHSIPSRSRLTGVLLLAAALLTSGCGGGAPKAAAVEGDREMLSAAGAGQLAFSRGAYDVAAQQYRRALARARLADDSASVGDQAYNLAACLMALGQWDASRAKLTEAEAATRRARRPLADVLLLEARLAYRPVGPADVALE